MSLKQVRYLGMILNQPDIANSGQEIETWVRALAHYDRQEFDEALEVFNGIADTSKILFNCGIIYATIGDHDKAVCNSGFILQRYSR